MNDSPGPRIAIAMRSYNDIDVIRGTLEAIRDQNFHDYQLWNFDSTSSDGTIDVIREFNDDAHIEQNDPRTYNPGTVMNDAVRIIAEGQPGAEIIVFINSDATPETPDWLTRMTAPFDDPQVAATFGRQTSRPDCRSLFRKDNERAFGDGSESARWVHFFSMANSAVRRSVIEAIPFETKVQYSEDIEWSYRLKKAGHKIEYVADAAATHSHNYTLKQSYKRMYGEGKAEAWIFREGEINPSFLRYFLLPFGMEVLRDIVWGIREASLDALLHTVPLRFMQKWGRYRGFKDGREFYGIS